MPRVAILDTPGLLHHVMIREIERRRIFNDNEDSENFTNPQIAVSKINIRNKLSKIGQNAIVGILAEIKNINQYYLIIIAS